MGFGKIIKLGIHDFLRLISGWLSQSLHVLKQSVSFASSHLTFSQLEPFLAFRILRESHRAQKGVSAEWRDKSLEVDKCQVDIRSRAKSSGI